MRRYYSDWIETLDDLRAEMDRVVYDEVVVMRTSGSPRGKQCPLPRSLLGRLHDPRRADSARPRVRDPLKRPCKRSTCPSPGDRQRVRRSGPLHAKAPRGGARVLSRGGSLPSRVRHRGKRPSCGLQHPVDQPDRPIISAQADRSKPANEATARAAALTRQLRVPKRNFAL